jgi:hypothetical protein
VRLWVFLKEKNLARLSREVGVVPKGLMRFDEVILVSNR